MKGICLLLQYIDHLKGVQVASEKLYLLQGDSPQICNWEEYGFQMQFQQNTLLSSATCEINIQALVGGVFQLPPNTQLVSAIYAVSFAENFLQPVKIGIQHCVQLNNDDQAQYLSFAIAPINPSTLPYKFEIVEGGTFTHCSHYGFIVRDTFCLMAILKFLGFQSNTVPNDLYFGQMYYSKSVINKWTMKFMIGKELNVLKKVCYFFK